MEISARRHDDYMALSLTGRLDLNSSAKLKEEIKKFLNEGDLRIMLDLNQVDFINSSGLGTLVSILKDVRMLKGRMVLCNLANYVQEIFEITQLSHIFDIYPTEQDAAASFSRTKVTVS